LTVQTGVQSNPPVLLEVNGVTLQYKTPRHLVTATYQVDFSVHQGDRYVILGPSGCGKSTLLKAVGGFMPPVEGTIRIRGHEVVAPGPDRARTNRRHAASAFRSSTSISTSATRPSSSR
jgi:NitT/TauT family transport system ATP-binding protein